MTMPPRPKKLFSFEIIVFTGRALPLVARCANQGRGWLFRLKKPFNRGMGRILALRAGANGLVQVVAQIGEYSGYFLDVVTDSL